MTELRVLLHLMLKGLFEHWEEDLGVEVLWVHGQDVVPWESHFDDERLKLFSSNLGSILGLGILVEVLGNGDHVVIGASLGALAATVILGVLADVASEAFFLDTVLDDNIGGRCAKFSFDLGGLFRGN